MRAKYFDDIEIGDKVLIDTRLQNKGFMIQEVSGKDDKCHLLLLKDSYMDLSPNEDNQFIVVD